MRELSQLQLGQSALGPFLGIVRISQAKQATRKTLSHLNAACIAHHRWLNCLAGELSVKAFSTMLFFPGKEPKVGTLGPPPNCATQSTM